MVKVDKKIKIDIIELHKVGFSTNRIIKTLQTRGITVSRTIVSYWVKAYISEKLDIERTDYQESKGYFNVVSVDDANYIKHSNRILMYQVLQLSFT
jgi:hypothetical protein